MITFRGRVVQIAGTYFAEVIEPPICGTYAARNRIELGLVPDNLRGLQRFIISDHKAYPADGKACSIAPERSSTVAESTAATSARWGWQRVALEKWEAAGRHGIVEAVTGSGKTYLAMEAWRRMAERHKQTYTLVVVPSILLQQQWHMRLRERFPDLRIALLGGGHKDSFKNGKICIAVINSVVGVGRSSDDARLHALFEHCRKFPENRSFLIADECHHYIHAEIFSRVRELVRYDAVLALSATVGESYQVKGLGKIVHSHTFADAIRQGDMPPLTLINVRCRLHEDEQRKHDDLTDSIREQLSYVQRFFAAAFDDSDLNDDFWQRLKAIDRAAGPDGEPAIRRLMVLFFKRTEVLHTAREKMRSAQHLVRAVLQSGKRRKVLLFFERIASAQDSAEAIALSSAKVLQLALATHELWTGVLHSGMDRVEREKTVAEFRQASHGILFTCRMLDEGFDVPDVDAAVIVASTKSRRQRVQRIGRVLRVGDGQKQPVVVTLFCERTLDADVVQDDRDLFGDETEIHSLTLGEAAAFIR